MVRRLLLAFLCTVAAWAQPKPADLVLRGGSIYCLDGPRSWAQTLAVRDGRIVYVGSETGLADYVGAGTQVLQLRGHMVLPGFCDAHVHPLLAGLEAMRCHLNDLPSADKVLATVRDYAGSHPDLPWIVGSGWGLPLFPQANPSRQALDTAAADRPVALESADGHSMWLNSKALVMCGINAQTPDPAGGRIEREPDGTPSGTLRENAMQFSFHREGVGTARWFSFTSLLADPSLACSSLQSALFCRPGGRRPDYSTSWLAGRCVGGQCCRVGRDGYVAAHYPSS